MSCAARRAARWISEVEDAPPIYLYLFRRKLDAVKAIEAVARLRRANSALLDNDIQLACAVRKPLGVFHGSELALVFDLKPLLFTKAERALADQAVSYWQSFSVTGHPDPLQGGVEWPRYDNITDTNIVLDTPIVTESGLKRAACDFWDSVGPLL